MANFVDYNGNNIEESLLVTDTSHGLISKENNLNYNDTYENRYNHGLCYIPNIQEQKVSTFRVYSRNKHPFIFIITYNLSPSIYIGTCYANDDNVTKPANLNISLILKAPDADNTVTARILKANIEYIDIEFTTDKAFWNSTALIIPGVLVKSLN